VIGMIADAELLADHRRHALGRPDRTDETESLGASGEQTGELCKLLGGQS
jgi:hypothetical protein